MTRETKPRGSATVKRHFDRLSASGYWSRLYAVADGATYHIQVRRARVLDLLPIRLGRVLDVGCGPGVMADAVLERGGTFFGVDVSPEMVSEAKRRFSRKDVRFEQGDIEHLGLADETFDQVICMGVIEYLLTPARALVEIARVLRPNGTAVVTVPKRIHADLFMIAATAPARSVARLLFSGTADRLPRLRLQPSELDAAALEAGLVADGGAQYHFTPLPYPITRAVPGLAMRLNAPFERWSAAQDPLRSFFAHGYIGRYRKESRG